MNDLVENILGGFLAAVVFALVGWVWSRATRPLIVTQQTERLVDRFPHLPLSGGSLWVLVGMETDYEAKGYAKARTRWLRRELHAYLDPQAGSGPREAVLMMKPINTM